MTKPLDATETAQWTAWKHAAEAVSAAVAKEIETAAGLSVADFSVLSRVIENGGGRMAQHELGAMLGWQRPRLSRQLSRMADRGLLFGETGPAGRRLITVTEAGRDALAAARPAHARAVRRVLLSPAQALRNDPFWNVLQRIAGDAAPADDLAELS
ncbi:helix-turn-helix domain-containing protein [Streptomyces sp. SID4982]|uniref:MarR family transcriptional regulator n=1 Tax=Streptomyces sp. SID4982 TaxID=2690291 RepID=UPI00136D1CE0|nr:MarR family transcriptional regulator [Streptomyces sp. SID4982]